MTPAQTMDDTKIREALDRIAAAGTQLSVEAGCLVAEGHPLNPAQMDFLLGHRAALVRMLSARRLWKVTGPDGSRVEHNFEPPATLEQVRGWYPGARVEPAEDDGLPDKAPEGAAPNLHGFSLADLEAAAGPEDWAEAKDNPAMPEALAKALGTSAQRDRGGLPQHYTKAVTCAHCGPVWLWEGLPDTVLGCPWCSTVAAGKAIPRPPKRTLEEEAKP